MGLLQIEGREIRASVPPALGSLSKARNVMSDCGNTVHVSVIVFALRGDRPTGSKKSLVPPNSTSKPHSPRLGVYRVGVAR